MESTVHGSFALAAVELALPAHAIQEVVNEPERYDPLPMAPDYALGLLNLRGRIIPVVDLRMLFQLEDIEPDSKDTKKIAVIERDSLCIGLLFSDIREVFNASTVEQCLFDTHESDFKRRVLRGVFKLDQGQRIVHILDVDALFQLEDLSKTVIAPATASEGSRNVRRQCISFTAGDARCGLDISAIKEIIVFEKIHNKVFSSDLCLGAIELRGETVPIVDLRQVLGYGKSVDLADCTRVMVLRVESHLIGFPVDSIDNIVSYFERELIAYPDPGAANDQMFEGCLADSVDEAHILLIDHDRLFSSSDVLEVARGHGTLFQSDTASPEKAARGFLNSQSLITFSLDACYALDIRDVKEVITQPARLIATPNSRACIKGMFDLRGELVTLINPGSPCGENPEADPDRDSPSKVLIYECENVKYGLVVRSVDSIIKYCSTNAMKLPGLLARRDGEWTIGNAVKQVVRVDGETISILDLEDITANILA